MEGGGGRERAEEGVGRGSMVLLLYGNLEIGAHVTSNPSYLICLRYLIRSRIVTIGLLFIRKDLFSFMHAQHVLSYHVI